MATKSQYTGLIFYIFISILLISVAIPGALSFRALLSPSLLALYVLLFVAHIGLYWVNLLCHKTLRWSACYYVLQALLIIALVSFPYDRDRIRISILGSTSMCVIGETLGLWGNTRRSLFIGLFYAGLVVALLYLYVESQVFLPVLGSLSFNAVFIVLFMIVLNQQFAERDRAQELAETLESANARLAANAAQIEMLTLQNERQRMARELHDTLAQGLSGLVLQLEAVKAHLAARRTDRAAAIIDQALVRARSTLADSRAAIDGLRAVPVNLADSVREKVERFRQVTGISCELELRVPEEPLASDVIAHALSILDESLSNITRHAQATKVNIRFVVEDGRLAMDVRDNGRGFDVDTGQAAGHYGLLGMHERARLAGGVLVVESSLGGGTHVQFYLDPVPEEARR
jgi:NarL family two-component system sensor histidine kinase YdfH